MGWINVIGFWIFSIAESGGDSRIFYTKHFTSTRFSSKLFFFLSSARI
jgi:hypothetical protein